MQGLRKDERSAITKVKVFSPEICLVALGQGFLHLEAGSAARDKGRVCQRRAGVGVHGGSFDGSFSPPHLLTKAVKNWYNDESESCI